MDQLSRDLEKMLLDGVEGINEDRTERTGQSEDTGEGSRRKIQIISTPSSRVIPVASLEVPVTPMMQEDEEEDDDDGDVHGSGDDSDEEFSVEKWFDVWKYNDDSNNHDGNDDKENTPRQINKK